MKMLLLKNLKPQTLNYISILCAFTVPLIVTGPFLPDLFISCLSIWFLYFTLKNKIYYIYKNIYFYYFVGFWIVCIFSSILSDNIYFSLKSSLFYIRIGIFSLLIAYLIDQNKIILDYFYFAFIITFTALIIDGYIQFFSGFNIFSLPLGHNFRVSSFFGDELILGSYLSRLLPLFMALFIARQNKKLSEIYISLILFLGTYSVILLSGERFSFLLVNFAIIFIFIFISNYTIYKIALSAMAVLICILFLKDDKVYQRWFGPQYTPASLIKSFSNDSKEKYFISAAHDSFFRTGWTMFADKPILGHGPKMFRIKCDELKLKKPETECSTHPHNFYIQMLSETGIVGFSFLISLLIYFFYIILKHTIYRISFNKKLLSNYQICLFAGLLITIWPLSASGNFFNNTLMILYGLQFGFFKKSV
jgi:O-antigen ligase